MNAPDSTLSRCTALHIHVKMAPDHYHFMGTPVTTLSVHKADHDNVANDVPTRFELFLLGDGEKKVTWAPETRVPDAAVFTFNKEDHTLANLLRAKLAKSPNILFSAYKVPHPLFATFELRVQTDGSLTPKDAVIRACGDLIQELQRLDQEFTKEWELKKIAGQGRDGL
ncbi:RBP11-like subunits of RNA polymerase [Aureobasidium sp. EXF-3400]|nr:RBP11-like subunits of RNA polymerase [Aureobasidium sp. EXF-12344]KAI4773827.1 RBP11-like subunits of RNA polymerase [Aureobasidium sp. EXF-3400]